MSRELESRLNNLEQDTVRQLSGLPDAQPSAAFERSLWERLESAHAKREAGKLKWKTLLRMPKLGLIAASLLLVLAGGVLTESLIGKDQAKSLGTLITPLSAVEPRAMAFRLGERSKWSDIEFQLSTELPADVRHATVRRLERPQFDTANALQLAAQLGIEKASLVSQPADGGLIYVEGSGQRLWVDSRTGSWYLEYTDAQGGSRRIDGEQARQLALDWLAQKGLTPEDAYQVSLTPIGDEAWSVSLSPQAGPDGYSIVGGSPAVKVQVSRNGTIFTASGAWYASTEDDVLLPIIGFEQAMQALQHGEGELNSPGFTSYQEGSAVIQRVELGYQLAFGLDYTPYLVPVAAFYGELTPEGRDAVTFSAYVSLLEFEEKHNSGNFQLATSPLPARAEAPVLTESPVGSSESELPLLRELFGAGGDLSTTSWDGGWLWRGEHESGSKPAGAEAVVELARSVAGQIAALPGELGDAEIVGMDEKYALVRFDLLYDGIVVDGLGMNSGSYLAMQIRLSDGVVTQVNCARPMQSGEKQPLLSSEQAWSKLLDNQAVIYLDDFGDALSGSKFVADSSRVTSVRLAYVPRFREFARNEHYDLKYIFSGTAQVGSQTVKFSALVDAVEEK